MKNQKGITLVALVITIIVLLILAGVSISIVVGQNGVLTQATSAVLKNQAANVREKVSMALGSADVAYNAAWAMDQSTTRSLIFNQGGSNKAKVKEQLTADGITCVDTPSAMPDSKPTETLPKADVLYVYPATTSYTAGSYLKTYLYGGNYYTFDVFVTETGTVKLGETVKVWEAKGTSSEIEFK